MRSLFVESCRLRDIEVVLHSTVRSPAVEYCKDLMNSINGVVSYRPIIDDWTAIYVAKFDGYVAVPPLYKKDERYILENVRKERFFRYMRSRADLRSTIKLWWRISKRKNCDNFKFWDAIAYASSDLKELVAEWPKYAKDRKAFVRDLIPNGQDLIYNKQIGDFFEVLERSFKVSFND